MKNIIEFLIFILYTSIIFFLPNNYFLIIPLMLNIILMFIKKSNIKLILRKILNIMPFIIFTFIINIILDEFKNACFIGIKIVLVCNITFVYSQNISTLEFSKMITKMCMPLKIFNINSEEIGTIVAISLSMIPVFKKELREIKDASCAKNVNLNIKNSKIILSKFLLTSLKKINEIDDALVEKGYDF